MTKPRFYVDTSVIGGCLDEGFTEHSQRLFEEFRGAQAIAVISSITLAELEQAPAAVRAVLAELPDEAVDYVEFDDDAAILADAYLSEGVVGPGSLADAQQVAIATVQRVDVLVSWNFRHIVNLNRIRLFAAVNLKHGLPTPEIRSPQEVLDAQEEF
jgi:predicted nucleic acid-binding protein